MWCGASCCAINPAADSRTASGTGAHINAVSQEERRRLMLDVDPLSAAGGDRVRVFLADHRGAWPLTVDRRHGEDQGAVRQGLFADVFAADVPQIATVQPAPAP